MEIREIIGNTTATPNPPSDWNQTDSTKVDYIKNKPDILSEERIINLIETYGGDEQIQADWNQTDEAKTDYIKNKPDIGELASKDKITMGDLNSDVQEYLAGIEASTQNTYIRYSEYSDGRNFTSEWTQGQNYIGIAVADEAPTEADEYEWSLFASNIRNTVTVTLDANNWVNNSQTITISSIGNNSSVFCTPHPDSKDVYIDCGIILESATISSVTFSCHNAPSIEILVNVQIIEPVLNVDELPKVNEDDNGKFLQVIDGKWQAVALIDGSKEGM